MTLSNCCDFFINNAIVIKATMKPTQVKQIIEEKIALLLLCQQVLLAEVWRSGVKSVFQLTLSCVRAGMHCRSALSGGCEEGRTGGWSCSVTRAGQRAWSNNGLHQAAEGCSGVQCQHISWGSTQISRFLWDAGPGLKALCRWWKCHASWNIQLCFQTFHVGSRFWFKARKADFDTL